LTGLKPEASQYASPTPELLLLNAIKKETLGLTLDLFGEKVLPSLKW
jgi:hypothetical protein